MKLSCVVPDTKFMGTVWSCEHVNGKYIDNSNYRGESDHRAEKDGEREDGNDGQKPGRINN